MAKTKKVDPVDEEYEVTTQEAEPEPEPEPEPAVEIPHWVVSGG